MTMRNKGIPRRPSLHDPMRPPSPWPIILASALPFAVAIIGVILLTVMARAASPAEERCQQLREMDRAWKGVELTVEQRVIKARLVAWYRSNCGPRREKASVW